MSALIRVPVDYALALAQADETVFRKAAVADEQAVRPGSVWNSATLMRWPGGRLISP